jgi:DNA-directed RNA polymerase specialized sigma24 family protein
LVGHFVGLTIPETASALGISESTVEREWRFLRTVLQEALDPEENRS